LKAGNILRSIASLACLIGAAQEAPVFRPGPDVTAPFVIAKATPAYTEEARLAKLEGSVLLSLVVGADGQPRDIQVGRALGLGLDEKAVENVRAWQFKPGTKKGIPVAVRVQEEVFFRPERTLWDWHVVRAAFRLPTLETRPVLIKVKFPPTVDLEENASVTIAFDISPKGVPANLDIVKSSAQSGRATCWRPSVMVGGSGQESSMVSRPRCPRGSNSSEARIPRFLPCQFRSRTARVKPAPRYSKSALRQCGRRKA
jgi:TonB family protein